MANVVKRLGYIGTAGGGSSTAAAVSFDNDDSGLQADNVQDAIDEVVVKIEAEVIRATGAETVLTNWIAGEVTDRQNADIVLQGNIDTVASGLASEITNRQNADTTLTTAIGNEQAARIAADQNLQDQIDALPDPVVTVFGRIGPNVVAVAGDYTATQISNSPSGTTSSTTVQGAINEIAGDVAALVTGVSSVNGATGAVVLTTTNVAEGTNLYYTDERAQDAVGTILTDSTSVDFTYNDAGNTITAAVLPAGVNHDLLLNFVANKHIDHSAVSITTTAATSGLSGGGTIAATRTLVVDILGTTLITGAVAQDDLVMIQDTSAVAKRRITVAGLLGTAAPSAGDLAETSFTAANNISTPTAVTGLTFATATVQSFEVLASVSITATGNLFQVFKIYGINRGTDWSISYSSTGDVSGVAFDITSAGQITYTSANITGFTAGVIKFKARTTSV